MSRFGHRYHRGSSGRINMTPLIDVTFLLLTFFMLASHFASAEKTDIDLPEPDNSQAVVWRLEDKIIINVLYRGELVEPELRLGPVPMRSGGGTGGPAGRAGAGESASPGHSAGRPAVALRGRARGDGDRRRPEADPAASGG